MDIQHAIDTIVAANGKAFVTTPLSSATRGAMEGLAILLGVQEPCEQGLSDAELVRLYSVARINESKARKFAARMNGEQAPTPSVPEMPAPTPSVPEMPAPTPSVPEMPAPTPSVPEMPAPTPSVPEIDLAAIKAELRAELTGELTASLTALIQSQTAMHVTVSALPDGPKVDLGHVHEITPAVIAAVGAGIDLYLYGEAGSGKSTMASKVAKALSLDFHATGKVSDEFGLLGFVMPNGKYFETAFRRAYEHGGLFLFDEIDRSHDNALTALNMALANGCCAFPDKLVYRNPNFRIIASGNTAMLGGDDNYSAAQKQDGAFRDRFSFMPMNIDEKLETAIAPNKQWAIRVQAIRKAIKAYGNDAGISATPRATLQGAILLASGEFTQEQVEHMTIFKGADEYTIKAILSLIPNNAAAMAIAA